jgi:hypothetical protein
LAAGGYVDRVLTINDYYDGPRLGIAEFGGVAHIYEAEFDHSWEDHNGELCGDTYFVSPIAPDLLDLVLEDWAIWLRWDAAFKSGETDLDTHPALPHERLRHEELKQLTGDRLRTDPQCRRRVRATFGGKGWDGTTVEWTDV